MTFAQEGGHIMLEGGELGYDQYGSGDFATYVMHSNDWNHDSAGNVEVADASLYILNNPNPACQPLTITYTGYGDSDAMVPLPDAVMPMNWSDYPTDAAMITYDPNPAPEGGQIVFRLQLPGRRPGALRLAGKQRPLAAESRDRQLLGFRYGHAAG